MRTFLVSPVAVVLVCACPGPPAPTGCEPGARSCDGADVQSCDASRAWVVIARCPSSQVCAAGACVEPEKCSPAARRCWSGLPQFCDEGGTWKSGVACAAVERCVSGACMPALEVVSFELAGDISKLISDPKRPAVYALNVAIPSEVVVMDTATHSVSRRIPLPADASDFDLSPNGEHMVVGHARAQKLSVLDLDGLSVAQTLTVTGIPTSVEVGDDGIAYGFGSYGLERVDLATGAATQLGYVDGYANDAELSADGKSLYGSIGASNFESTTLVRFDLAGTGPDGDASDGQPYARARPVFLSPGGQHVYFADRQFDPSDLSLELGSMGEEVLAEDRAGTIAVGATRVFDARLASVVAALPYAASAATLAKGDLEIWRYCPVTRSVHVHSVQDVLGGASLGKRERSAEPLSRYSLSRLARDPTRDLLYGLDASRRALLVLDGPTLQATLEIAIPGVPSDFAVDLDGSRLYVGLKDIRALARIDLATARFDGLLPTPEAIDEVEALADHRVAVAGWSYVNLVDGSSGAALPAGQTFCWQCALTATADGRTLFMGQSSYPFSQIGRYSVAGDKLTKVDESDYEPQGRGFDSPLRSAVAVPDGSGVFYGGFRLNGADLSLLDFAMPEHVYGVTSDGKKVVAAGTVYDAATGTALGALPHASTVVALGPDGKSLYQFLLGTLEVVDLSSY